MPFLPRFCPRAQCASHSGTPFTFRHRGRYKRFCDQRLVQRFQCLVCKRGFSEQTFRVNYRLKRPGLLPLFFLDRVSKVTHRQSARNHRCSRATEERHFRRLCGHCEAFHGARLREVSERGGLGEVFLLDELETYEHNRIEKPVTVPILIERHSGFVIEVSAGTLPPRGSSAEARRRKLESASEGTGADKTGDEPAGKDDARQQDPAGLPRTSESRQLVKAAFTRLGEVSPKTRALCVLTDCKPSYAQLLREIFGERCQHTRIESTRRRDVRNPLWPINHTLARVRDNVSRLVRETWAAAKKRRWLAGQLAIWVCYRNYVRNRTNRSGITTPAMALGAQKIPWSVPLLLQWRVFPLAA